EEEEEEEEEEEGRNSPIRQVLETVDEDQEARLQMLMEMAEEIRREIDGGLEEVRAQHWSSSSSPSSSSGSSRSSSPSWRSTSSSSSSSTSSSSTSLDSDSDSYFESDSDSNSDSDPDSDSDFDSDSDSNGPGYDGPGPGPDGPGPSPSPGPGFGPSSLSSPPDPKSRHETAPDPSSGLCSCSGHSSDLEELESESDWSQLSESYWADQSESEEYSTHGSEDFDDINNDSDLDIDSVSTSEPEDNLLGTHPSSPGSYFSNIRLDKRPCKRILLDSRPSNPELMTCKSPGCNQSYSFGRELMKHQRMKHHLFCHLCREFFDTYESFMEHIFYETHDTRMQYPKDDLGSPSLSSGNEETNEDNDDEDDYSDNLYYCPYEGCQVRSGFKFIDHLAAHRRRQEHWYCRSCELFFNSNEEWDMHNLLNKRDPSTELDKFHQDTGSKVNFTFVSASQEPPPFHSILGSESTEESSTHPASSSIPIQQSNASILNPGTSRQSQTPPSNLAGGGETSPTGIQNNPSPSSQPPVFEGPSVTFNGPGYTNYTTTRAPSLASSDYVPELSRSTEFSGDESPVETLVYSTDDEDTLYDPYTPYVSRTGSPTIESNSSNDHDSDSEDPHFSNNSSASSNSELLNPPGSEDGDEEVGPKTFKCRHCLAMFPNGKTLFVHLAATRHFLSSQYTSSPGRVENESLFRTNWDATPFLCRPCGTRFINVEDLEEHFLNLHANRNFAWMWDYCACGKSFENRWIDVLHHLDSGLCESGIGAGWIDRMVEKGAIDTEWKNSFLETLEKQEQEGTGVETNTSSHESSNNCQWTEDAEDEDENRTSTSSASSSSFINFDSSSDGNYTGSDSVKSSSGVSGADERESNPGSEKGNANHSRTDTSRDRTQDDPNETWYFVNVDQSAHETVVQIQSASDGDANEEDHEDHHDLNEIDHLVNAVKDLFGSLKQRLIRRVR
ncbi:hypothetical protein TWF225_006491, partial [Orbilia oligospora]